MQTSVRPPAVAGTFYPGRRGVLLSRIEELLATARIVHPTVVARMLIVPHAGYGYSGPVAATAFRILASLGQRRIGLVGPSHYVRFSRLATPIHDAMSTPLGSIEIDPIVTDFLSEGLASPSEAAHRSEHSLEVQLPFLQIVAPDATVVPLLTGDDDPMNAAEAVGSMADMGLFVLISSDLSHYHDYETARRLDRSTAEAIIDLRESDLDRHSACGLTAVQAAIRVAAKRDWGCELIDLRSSGDTQGARDRVVGYGAFVLGPRLGG